MWNGIKLDKDSDIHVSGSDNCFMCLHEEDYPQRHTCGGYLHAEYRFDMEAGRQERYVITRCDRCNNESSGPRIAVSNDNRRRG